MLKGRSKIYTSVSESGINDSNIVEILEKAIPIHQINRTEIEFLMNYKKGEQPILNRIKEIRPEINNKIVVNHALEIVDFEASYNFGNPIMYVHRNKQDGNEKVDDGNITAFNNMLFQEMKMSKDRSLGETAITCGIGYRMIFPKIVSDEEDICPFDIVNLDPLNTFVIHSNDVYQKPVLGVTYVTDENGRAIYTVYSKDFVWVVKQPKDSSKLAVIDSSINYIGLLPIIEFRNNDDYIGSFEPVLHLIDAIDILTSDRLNDISQFVQNLLWLNNCELDDPEQAVKDGCIQTKSTPGVQANITYLTQIMDQSGVQAFSDYLYQQMIQIVGKPGRERATGGNTGEAIKLSDGWQIAEEKAKSKELIFNESLREELKVEIRILKTLQKLDIRLSDIEIKFNRNKTSNLLVKTQGLLNMLTAGVHPRVAITHCDLFSDPQQTYIDSETGGYLDKWKAIKAEGTNSAEDTNGLAGTEQQIKE